MSCRSRSGSGGCATNSSTLVDATGTEGTSRVDLVAALLDTARQEPELCSLVRQRCVDSLYRAAGAVVDHAAERGDGSHRTHPQGEHPIAVSAAIAPLVHWSLVRDRPIADDDIATIVDEVLMPLL